MSAGATRDPQKEADEADVRKHIAAFFAKGGRVQVIEDGVTNFKGDNQAFTITAANKKGAA